MRGLTVALLLGTIALPAVGRPGTVVANGSPGALHPLQAAGALTAYTGTAEVTDAGLPRFDLPSAALNDTGQFSATVHFAAQDRSHFRIDVQITNPAIDSGTLSLAANGHTITSYDDRSHLAFVSPIPRKHRAAILDALLGSMESGAQIPDGPVTQPDPTQPISAYLALLRHPQFNPGVSFHARIVGQGTVLGHTVDIIDYGPTIVKAVSDVCSSSAGGKTCRPSKFHGSGSVRLWVDRTHPFILQAQDGGGPTDPHDIGYSFGTSSYHVTSVVYGQGPSNADLELQPAAPVVKDTFPFAFEPRGGDSGPGPGVSPPGPFVYPGSAPPPLATSEGIQRLGFGPHYKIAQVSALFSTGKHAISYFYKPTKLGPTPHVKGPYLFVQERLRPDGLPVALQIGTPQAAGGCQAWTGTYSDGQQWIAFTKKKAAVVMTTGVP